MSKSITNQPTTVPGCGSCCSSKPITNFDPVLAQIYGLQATIAILQDNITQLQLDVINLQAASSSSTSSSTSSTST
jgi:hypothetical protein